MVVDEVKDSTGSPQRCSDIKVRLSQDEFHSFELFVNGRHDPAITDSDSDQENYTCPCGKIFKKKTAYQRHMDTSHSSTVSYHCNVCGKTFGKKCTLTMHMSIHGSADKKAFDSMERPSTRSRTRTVAGVSSPLREKKTDIVKQNTVIDNNNTIRVTRSLSKDNNSNTVKVEKYATRSSSKDNNVKPQGSVKTRANSRSTSRSVERKDTIAFVKNKDISQEKDANKSKDNSSSVCSDNSDNNNVTSCLNKSKIVSVTEEINKDNTDKQLQEAVDNIPVLQSNSSHERDKENTDLETAVVSNSGSSEEADLAVSSIISQVSGSANIKTKENIQVIKLRSDLIKDDHFIVHTNNNNNILLEKTAIKTERSHLDNNNTVSVVNKAKVESQSEAKSNTQTIVIVIREAKRLKPEVPESTSLVYTSKPEMIATQNIVPVNAVGGSYQQNIVPVNAAIQNGLQQQKMIIENNNLIAKQVITNQVKPVVSRTVVSVAPSVVTPAMNHINTTNNLLAMRAPSFNQNALNMGASRTASLDQDDHVVATDSELSHLSGDGETTESDDGIDEYAPIRKSARLDGKVPGWKKILTNDNGIAQLVEEPRQRKRKVGRPRLDDHEVPEDGELSDVAEELFGDVAAEMDIDDQEIKDMSSSLFAKRPRTYKDEYSCEICGKSFSTEKYLQMHSSLHGASTPARNLVAENYKVNELKDVDGYRSTWTCKICNKSFAQNSSFKNHMRTHSDERPFVCDVCCIGFKERYHLKKHMLFKHSDELKEKCQFCGKRFKDSTAVRAHERIHSDHRPYPCRRCGKAFKTSECLWHHENRSKTCGAMGGPPLPPLPKKGRTSRKNKNLQEQMITQTLTLKKEENNMLDLVQQIIQSDSSQLQQQQKQHPVAMTTQHVNVTSQNLPVKSQYATTAPVQQYHFANPMTIQSTVASYPANISVSSIPSTAVHAQHQQQTYIQQSTSIQQQNMVPTYTTIKAPVVSAQPHQVQTVKINHGQAIHPLQTIKLNQSQNFQTQPLQTIKLSQGPNTQTQQFNTVKVSQGAPTQPPQQTHTVKLNQGQSLVFSVPVLKDGNIDPAAQVTKAILDAISNTTGHLKGNINIQKTIQCAVNNVQEAFHPNKNVQANSQNGFGQLKVPVSVAKNPANYQMNELPHAVDLSNYQKVHQPIPSGIVQSISQPQDDQTTYVMGHQIKQEPDVQQQPACTQVIQQSQYQQVQQAHALMQVSQHQQQQQQLSQPVLMMSNAPTTTKPYLVSILPPIASVAQALKPEIKTEAVDQLEDDYSTDSGDEDDMEDSIPPAVPTTIENKMFTSYAPNSRPVAAVQPVRRVELDVKPYTMEYGVIESTNEPYIAHPSRVKQSNYTCPKCQKGFASLSAFQKHLLKHEEVRPFRCDTCDIGFKLKVHLKKHNLYRHSTDYPCECSICGKRFKDSSAVRLHERIHSEDRPFQCGCGKSFKTKENLWGHQNRKMCPYAGYPPPTSSCDTSQYYHNSPIQAHAKVEDGEMTAHASVKSLSNKIIAEAVVANKRVTAQATIGQNGEAHARVYPNVDTKPAMEDMYTVQSPEQNPVHTSVADHKAILKTENGDIYCTVSLPSSTHSSSQSQLPSFETFATSVSSSSRDSQMHLVNQPGVQIKKESIADQCPTIQNLLKRGPRSVTKLPGIQQLFKQHIKPPPPYPGHMTPPRCYSDSSSYSSQCSESPDSSPTHGMPSSPIYNRQNSQSPITSSNLNVMLNPDQLYATGTTHDPFLRTPPPPLYAKSESNHCPSDYSPTTPTSGMPKSPRVCHAVSPAPSGHGDGSVPPIIYWDDEAERKPVVAQWQQTDSETLFHELSNSMINQL